MDCIAYRVARQCASSVQGGDKMEFDKLSEAALVKIAETPFVYSPPLLDDTSPTSLVLIGTVEQIGRQAQSRHFFGAVARAESGFPILFWQSFKNNLKIFVCRSS